MIFGKGSLPTWQRATVSLYHDMSAAMRVKETDQLTLSLCVSVSQSLSSVCRRACECASIASTLPLSSTSSKR